MNLDKRQWQSYSGWQHVHVFLQVKVQVLKHEIQLLVTVNHVQQPTHTRHQLTLQETTDTPLVQLFVTMNDVQ